MICKRIFCAMTLVGFLIWLASCPAAMAKTEQGHVPLIMLNPQGAATSDQPRLRKLYAAIKKRAASAAGRAVTLTRTQVEAVRKVAARRGVTWGRPAMALLGFANCTRPSSSVPPRHPAEP